MDIVDTDAEDAERILFLDQDSKTCVRQNSVQGNNVRSNLDLFSESARSYLRPGLWPFTLSFPLPASIYFRKLFVCCSFYRTASMFTIAASMNSKKGNNLRPSVELGDSNVLP